MTTLILGNYETFQFSISHPQISNIVILAFLFIVVLASFRRQTTSVLDHVQTDQIRGIAVLLLLSAHVWYHVVDLRNNIMLSDTSIFLLFSGYGLSVSLSKKKFSLSDFVNRRLRRVMIPYWVFTLLWLSADYVFLNKTYSTQEILYTALGINFIDTIQHIDYMRWYVTMLLIWYVGFACVNMFFSQCRAIICLFALSAILLYLQITKVFLLGNSSLELFAFPIGMLLAYYRNEVTAWLLHRYNAILLGVFFVLIYLLLPLSPGWLISVDNPFQVKVARYGFQQISCISICGLITLVPIIMGSYGYTSRFLISWGKISYEAFLAHGPLLIKYNPIMPMFPDNVFPVTFIVFLAILWVLSLGSHKLFSFRFELSALHSLKRSLSFFKVSGENRQT